MLKVPAAPVPSEKMVLPLPASVVTTPLNACGAAPPTLSASACGAAPAPTSPAAAPHSSTATDVLIVAAHLTHALALKATLPLLGSAAGALAPATVR